MGTDGSPRSDIQYTALTPTTRKFRKDIAFIRALAIISVLGYHFWPDAFGLGFIGVDIFFVLSGYLIMGILSADKSPPKEKLADFYYKRIKRICPLYYMILLVIVGGVWLAQFFPHFWSVILMHLNLKLYASDGDYFAESTESLPFLHTWSLGVEMQFYLVAPCLYYLTRCKIASRAVGVLFAGLIFVSSLYYQWSSTPITAFYHPFARMWQFLAGMLASHFSEEETKYGSSGRLVDFATIGLVIPVFAIFLPNTIVELGPQSSAQFAIPAIVAIFLMVSSYSDRINWSRFRLNYIATISYALYLIHYPVLKYAQHLQPRYFESIPVWTIALPVTILLATACHHFYEKPMLHAKKKTVFMHVVILFIVLLIVAIQWKPIFRTDRGRLESIPEAIEANKKSDRARSAAIEANKKWFYTYWPQATLVKDGFKNQFGHYVWPNNTGQLRVVVVGNSYAVQQQVIVRKFLPPSMTASLDVYAAASYSIVFHRHEKLTKLFWEEMERKKPNIVFILMRYAVYLWPDGAVPLRPGNDEALNYWLQAVNRLSKFADHIFISSHHPFEVSKYFGQRRLVHDVIAALENGQDLSKLNFPYNAQKFAADPVRVRINLLLQQCKKCRFVDIESPFINKEKNWVQTYDPVTNIVYYDVWNHYTDDALKLIEPNFEKAIRAALPEYFP